jgi:O-antigen/teichoic acid export membrane protein
MIKSQLLSAIIVIVGNIILTPVYGWFAAVIMTAGGYVFACIFTIKYSAFNVKRSKL